MNSKRFVPNWYEETAPLQSYRALFKWGDLSSFKHPNQRLFELMREAFHMVDTDFGKPIDLGLEKFELEIPTQIKNEHFSFFVNLLGKENVITDTFTRVKASYGKGMIDQLRLRKKIVENLPDVVLWPEKKEHIQSIVSYCDDHKLPVYIFGGGSTVTRGIEAVKGGVCLDLSKRFNKILHINEINQTVTVQAGISGPALEDGLNNAKIKFGKSDNYTCGHFPQSFEFSSVGGWVVTRGAGQNSTYYGKIEDMVLAQEYITPRGVFKSNPFPRKATGPGVDALMIGSEGSYGVLTEVTLKIFRYLPQNRRYYSYMFRNWEDALMACREVMQGEIGKPSVFRLSDAEETDVAMKLYGVDGSPADKLLQSLGFARNKKCLLLGTTDGSAPYTKMVNRQIRKICRKYKSFDLSLFNVAQRWEKDRFRDPYLREDLVDYGIVIDTLECAVTWEQMPKVHAYVRDFVKSHTDTICMTHLSHSYEQGGNLYFIFIKKMNSIKEYLDLQYGILEHIQKSGAAISHHHGVGKQTSPWLEENIGQFQFDLMHHVKTYLDPNNILNPGGTLGFDMNKEQKNKIWSMDLD
ncbi:MAG: FAD-binding oxidoreductase [Anaerolineaceae bacterium]|nr:FAD-binding oxidoreductase [Anaerolineaceae bacterium]